MTENGKCGAIMGGRELNEMLKGAFIEIFISIKMIEPDAKKGTAGGVGDGAEGFDVGLAITG